MALSKIIQKKVSITKNNNGQNGEDLEDQDHSLLPEKCNNPYNIEKSRFCIPFHANNNMSNFIYCINSSISLLAEFPINVTIIHSIFGNFTPEFCR